MSVTGNVMAYFGYYVGKTPSEEGSPFGTDMARRVVATKYRKPPKIGVWSLILRVETLHLSSLCCMGAQADLKSYNGMSFSQPRTNT